MKVIDMKNENLSVEEVLKDALKDIKKEDSTLYGATQCLFMFITPVDNKGNVRFTYISNLADLTEISGRVAQLQYIINTNIFGG